MVGKAVPHPQAKQKHIFAGLAI